MQSLRTIILVAVAIMTAQTSARTLNQRGLEAFAARGGIVCDIACEAPQVFCSPCGCCCEPDDESCLAKCH
ncbi:hypothetical protein JB92DRAFT_3043635 [Gautieria morchelliformis]|nr:hypothetical protein JB92DRAFT_3043635 [Gautieria morchelliformis]